ncbi:YcxB family protein [Zhouia sp. PK063]|uniref:YcxB family protein n=1 Tax=Zhouia sp. PK063 TaxID=3373602 RepID=UPI0037AA056F
MGLNLYFDGNTKPGIGYSGFMMFFGIYYLLKPLIIVLTQKAWFKNFDLDYEIQPEKIIINSGKSKSELDYSDLQNVLRRKTYFALKTTSKQGIYLPIKLLETTEIDILEKLNKN